MESRKNKISGYLIDENKSPIPNLIVKIWDNSGILSETELGESKTDDKGFFEVDYTHNLDSPSKDKIDLKLELLIDDESVMSLSKNNVPNIFDFGKIELNNGNIGIKGRVIDEYGIPISGLRVIAKDIDFGKIELDAMELLESKVKSLGSFIKKDTMLDNSVKFVKDKYNKLFFLEDDLLGESITDDNGYYYITYPQSRYKEILDKEPDIRIIVKDQLGVFNLFQTETYDNVEETIKYVDDIVINRAALEGWFVTLNKSSLSRFSQKNSFEILIDNKNALEKIVDAIDNAESYIHLTQFEFYPDYVPRFFKLDDGSYEADKKLVYKLLDANKRGASVKIIINENALVPDSFDEINNYFKGSDVDVRRFPANGPYAMHAKILVVDGKKAFIIGSPFTQAYWDTSNHFVNESRRLKKDEGPVHDVSIYLEGKSIEYVDEFFIELWNYLSDSYHSGSDKILKNPVYIKENSSSKNTEHVLIHDNPLKSVDEPIQIVRSVTPNTLNKKGEAGVLEAYRRAITNAEEFIYLENQYFTNKYIINALKNVIESKPDLQLIMVINEVPDVPTYRSWQHYGLKLLGLDLDKPVLKHPQIGVFALWSSILKNKENKLRHCYVHSKVTIVDDVWATIGSSNLDGSSLSCAEEFGNRETSKNHRNMEMNALLFDFESKGTIQNFRQKLWSEHLNDINPNPPSEEGWLDIWKKTAYGNIEKLEKNEINLYGDVLPYSAKRNAEEQVKDIIEQYRRLKGRFNL